MKVVYIAGPYRAPTHWEVVENVRSAEAAAIAIWNTGLAVPLCPHKNSQWLDGAVPTEKILAGDLELLTRCDAVYLLPRWELSEGARREAAVAQGLGLPLFMSFGKLEAWLRRPAEMTGTLVPTPVTTPERRHP